MSASFAKSLIKSRAMRGARSTKSVPEWSLGWVTPAAGEKQPRSPDSVPAPAKPAPTSAPPARSRSTGSNPKHRS